MTRLFFVFAAMCLTAAIALSCTATTPKKGKTVKKATTTKKVQTSVGDTIASLRYELYCGGESEVYYYSHDSKLNLSSFYTRDMGSNTGWSYTVDAEPVMPLSRLAAELKLDQYPDYNLDNEQKDRDRWIIIATYPGGKEKTICIYTNASTASNDKVVREKAEAAFKAIKFQDKDGKMMGEYSKTVYVGGKRTKEIFYTRDGIVRGGSDYDRPNDNPPLEYGVPEAPGKLY